MKEEKEPKGMDYAEQFELHHPIDVQDLVTMKSDDIHVAPGQEQKLPHEAWHVAQQRCQIPTGDGRLSERDATVMGLTEG